MKLGISSLFAPRKRLLCRLGVNGYVMKMAANFAFQTGNKKRKLFAYGRNLWFPHYSRICYHVMPCYYMFTLIFAKRAQSKQQNTECSPVATTCRFCTYVEITRIPLRQIDFKLVSIVECFRGRGV